MVATPTENDVATVYDGDPVANDELSSTEASDLIDSAVSMFENIFTDQILFLGEVADEDEAVKYLAAHKWALALGQTQSESQAGANVTYNVPQPVERSLRRTKYGLEFLEYTYSERNVAVFKT